MTATREHDTLDPATTGGDPPPDVTRHSTLTVRRLQVADRRVVVKVATGRTRAPLRAEAGILRLIGPHLAPEVVALCERDDRTDLVLDDVGRALVEGLPLLDGADRLQVLVGCARTLDRLHDAGWIHGALCAQHVVLDEAHRPRFVSFGSARPLADAPAARRDDLRQLLELVRLVAVAPMTSASPRRWRRIRRALERLADTSASEMCSSGEIMSALEQIECRTTVLAPTNRFVSRVLPSIGRFGRAASALVRTRAVAGRRFDVSFRAGEHWLPRLLKLISVLAITMVAATTLPRLWGDGSAASDVPQSAVVEPLRAGCGPESNGSVDNPSLDVTGDGCPDVVHVDGTVIEINGVPFRVGSPGDQVLVSDDDCDGHAQVHLFRPATGEHFVFDRLATSEGPAQARLIDVQPSVSELMLDRSEDRCIDAAPIASPSTTSTGDPP